MNTIRPILCIALLLGLPATVHATPTIIVGSHPNIAPGVASQTIDIFVTGLGPGANSISGVDLWVSIASGHLGALYGDPAPAGEPKINGVDMVTGTIFAGNSANGAPGLVLVAGDQVWEIQDTTISGSITTDGKLFTIDINTLGLPCGPTWSISVFGIDPADGPFNSTYSNAQVLGQVFLGSNGSIVGCPEPSSFVLALIAVGGLGAAIVRRRMRAS